MRNLFLDIIKKEGHYLQYEDNWEVAGAVDLDKVKGQML